MKWRKVVLSEADTAKGSHTTLQLAFRNLFHNHGCPRDAGMYQVPARPGEYLFSPGAWAIAWTLLESYNATECNAPKKSEVVPQLVKLLHEEAKII